MGKIQSSIIASCFFIIFYMSLPLWKALLSALLALVIVGVLFDEIAGLIFKARDEAKHSSSIASLLIEQQLSQKIPNEVDSKVIFAKLSSVNENLYSKLKEIEGKLKDIENKAGY